MSNFRKIGLTLAVAGATATMVGTVNSAGNNIDVWNCNNKTANNKQVIAGVEQHPTGAQCCYTGEDGTRSAYNNQGDAAVIPYYTTVGSFVTGMHVVNTTAATQAVKVRLRRTTDSADALDFNVVLSPQTFGQVPSC